MTEKVASEKLTSLLLLTSTTKTRPYGAHSETLCDIRCMYTGNVQNNYSIALGQP